MFYHCSPQAGLTLIEPRKNITFDTQHAVHLTTLLPMALMYGIKHFEYTYGFHFKDGKPQGMYYEECFPDALTKLYAGKTASLYVCGEGDYQTTKKPHEVICFEPVPVLEERPIPDVLAALLALEKEGQLEIIRFHQQTEKSRAFYRQAEKEVILKHNLLHQPGPFADYMRTTYPDSWRDAIAEAIEQP